MEAVKKERRDFAVLIPLVKNEYGEEIVLEKRSGKLKVQPGEICLPGGGIERKEDGSFEKPLEAAVRECAEELHVSSRQIRIEEALPPRIGPDGATVYPFAGTLEGYNGTYEEEEVDRILRIPLSFFLETEPERYPVDLVTVPREGFPYERIPGGREYPFRKKETEMLFYDYEGTVIWGLTAAVIDSYVRMRTQGTLTEETVREKYDRLMHMFIDRQVTVTTMESCTAGQIASLITDRSGASAVFRGAFITYSNEAKVRCGVPEEIIRNYGVYSAETAEAMAKACREAYAADIGIGITGSFGNTDPENEDSKPGEVFFAIASADGVFEKHLSIPPQKSRLMYKLYAANAVADELLRMIRAERSGSMS